MEAPGYHRTITQFPQVEKLHQHQGGMGMGVVKNAATTTENFKVEDLLDFSSNEEDALLELAGGGEVDMEVGFDGSYGGDCSTVTTTTTNSIMNNNTGAGGLDCSSNESSGSVVDPGFVAGDVECSACLVDPCLSGDLCVPYDELAELEWLSNFVEESFSSEDLEKLQLISGVKSSSSSETLTENSANTTTTVINTTDNNNSAAAAASSAALDSDKPPAKARSKRSRAAPVNWTSRLLLVQGSSPSVATMSESELLVPPPSQGKASKIVRKESNHDGLMPAPDGRKCLHCATDKTPQWRTGPLGPKTLCNACGVRYKSGRLVPEYRPAASPTFVMSKHSNSHRKVLELRRQKEIVQQQQLQQQQQSAQFMHHHHRPAEIYDTVAGAGNDEFLNCHHLGPDFRQLI